MEKVKTVPRSILLGNAISTLFAFFLLSDSGHSRQVTIAGLEPID